MKHVLTGGLVAALAVAAGLAGPASAAPRSEPAPAPQSYLAQRAAIPANQKAAAEAAANFETMAGTRPVLRVPFRCGENWSGASRSGHSPSYWSLDFNWGAGSDDLGKPVKASRSGTVVRSAFDAGGYGNYIEIAHGEGWHTLYAHLQSRAVGVGARVSDSQQIGRVGGTGNVTGPHLHYEQIRDNVVVQARFGQSTWASYPGPATYSRAHDC
ncbi:peptidase M23-like protein [Kribbella amoyensis]|uniref:Peptidase M23-like protein n=1 Tax=Kribbella amoyensis TaxID=996641 RepID=A0A561BLH7_9ACTN|nr:M23 family metallopeptidase [Kribbella amoyensis]TWD79705.1 peptidase M23-like protein [Kribbella amoyensis]